MNDVVVCTIKDRGDFGIEAQLRPVGRVQARPPMSVGRGSTVEKAISDAFGRVRLQFASAHDEHVAEVASFRAREFTIKQRGDEIITIGLA